MPTAKRPNQPDPCPDQAFMLSAPAAESLSAALRQMDLLLETPHVEAATCYLLAMLRHLQVVARHVP